MEIKIYNTLTKKVELFKPIKENEVSMYVCGPTVYNYIHVGNARPVIFFDVVRRFFEHSGYKVTFISNFTDIDDKIIEAAKKEQLKEEEVSEKYINAFMDSFQKLGCIPNDKNPKVTDHISNIIKFIQTLIDIKAAYVADGDVYFRVSQVSDYGILSGQTLENLEDGARILVNDLKEDPKDFTLWKRTDEGRSWDSPWSKGRPGWHTECVVMVEDYFKNKIDIHGGGPDLKFPHHENEIAQSECVFHHKLANYWMHNNRIDMAGEKMSKSLGNVIWLKDVLERVNPKAFRFFVLVNHYRQAIMYKEELLQQAVVEYEKVERTYINIYRKLELLGSAHIGTEYTTFVDQFNEEMANDFNTANAITVLYELMKEINKQLRLSEVETHKLVKLMSSMHYMLEVLGIEVSITPLQPEDKELIILWNNAKKNKDFILADELRKKIASKGIMLS
jgi:cysteinyl-tRNA synthetase